MKFMETSFAQKSQATVDSPLWVVSEKDLKIERRKALQNRALNKFQELGLIVRIEKDGDEVLVINNKDFFMLRKGDLEVEKKTVAVRLNNLLEKDEDLKDIMNSPDLGGERMDRTLFYIFQDKKSVLKGEDLSEARDLIYVPDTVDTAFDQTEILNHKNGYIFLFSDFSKSWQDTYPTKDLEFESRLSNFEVSTAMMVYGKGEAKRENGVLTVIKKVGGDSVERQRISGKWITENFGVRFVGAGRYWDSPVPLMKKFGDKLSKAELLTPQDFERPNRELRVLQNGKFQWKGSTYALGREYSNDQLVNLGGDVFAILDDNGNLKTLFETTVNTGAESLVKVQTIGSKGLTKKYIPHEAINFLGDEKSDSINLVSFGSEQRNLISISKKDSVNLLQKLKTDCEIRGIDTKDLNINELMFVSIAFNQASEQERIHILNFASKFGVGGLKFIAEGYAQGGIDKNIYKLVESDSPVIENVFDIYSEVLENSDRLNNLLLDRSKDLISRRDFDAFRLFNSRINEAVRLKAMGLLRLSLKEPNQSIEQIKMLNILVTSIYEAANPIGDMHADSEKPDTYLNSRSTRSFSGDSESPLNGNKLVVTARPIPTQEGQARIQFQIKDVTNKSKTLNMRVDRDEIGASLDLGNHDGITHRLLNMVGVSHQTHVVFEKQFSNPETFARMVKTYAKIFDMDIWN